MEDETTWKTWTIAHYTEERRDHDSSIYLYVCVSMLRPLFLVADTSESVRVSLSLYRLSSLCVRVCLLAARVVGEGGALKTHHI